MKLLIYLSLVSLSTGYKILILVPSAVKSEVAIVNDITTALAEKNHSITIVSANHMSTKHSNIHHVFLKEIYKTHEVLKMLNNEITDTSDLFKATESFFLSHAEIFWSDSRIMALWDRRKEYELFITMSYYSEYTFPFLMDFDGPFVQICLPGVEAVSMSREGNWLSPAVFPSFVSVHDNDMTFMERLINVPSSIRYFWFSNSVIEVYTAPAKKRFPALKHHSSYYDRVALTLINGHFALDGPVPLLPSQIEIGTINAKKPQPLPKDLEDFMNGSGDAGVIYFSLGSIAKSADIPQKAKEMFVEAFRRVPQRVLWKYEGTDLQLPPNVKTQSWMPQQDILGHPKTRVFISHCGNLGTQEAKYHGVPVLGVPIAFDQPRKAASMEKKGYAVVLHWNELATDKILDALDKLINDKTYKERIKTLSVVLQDQMDDPAERAVWWLEYVVRHKGAPHLQYAGRRLSLFQYIMLDVILFWTTVLFLFISIIISLLKLICCRSSKIKIEFKRKAKKNQ